MRYQFFKSLGELSETLLFVHSFFGCDTTSRFFGFAKQTALHLAKSDATFKKAAMVFNYENSPKEEIIAAGEQVTTRVYKDNDNESLLALKVRMFEHKVCTSTDFVHPETLPPTPPAVKYHSLRVYLQIME
ncbi:hypothetical protein PR048_005629 [Dryococelus australis]|uniref:Uncharacterized protein n=1 Tax=Dryococelus australis TaxID=614101 RepID=A0ABQ9IAV3_9NEOP|nr:hypothetical protein PR048_005629 [Dryococelus australis]